MLSLKILISHKKIKITLDFFSFGSFLVFSEFSDSAEFSEWSDTSEFFGNEN
jgi:hypothetical protein